MINKINSKDGKEITVWIYYIDEDKDIHIERSMPLSSSNTTYYLNEIDGRINELENQGKNAFASLTFIKGAFF